MGSSYIQTKQCGNNTGFLNTYFTGGGRERREGGGGGVVNETSLPLNLCLLFKHPLK